MVQKNYSHLSTSMKKPQVSFHIYIHATRVCNQELNTSLFNFLFWLMGSHFFRTWAINWLNTRWNRIPRKQIKSSWIMHKIRTLSTIFFVLHLLENTSLPLSKYGIQFYCSLVYIYPTFKPCNLRRIKTDSCTCSSFGWSQKGVFVIWQVEAHKKCRSCWARFFLREEGCRLLSQTCVTWASNWSIFFFSFFAYGVVYMN